MKLFAISDLHLPGGDDKPMTVFGDHWQDHFQRISTDWIERVSQDDVVLLPGDMTWAMQLADALPDLETVDSLPGRKVLLRGNHDYWWSTITKVRDKLPQGMTALQNDAVDMGPFIVCGTRGWSMGTQEEPLSPQDAKITAREVNRLQLSLQQAMRIRGESTKPIVVMMHYPPVYSEQSDTVFTQCLDRFPIDWVVYGHLHGNSIRLGFNGIRKGVGYKLVSCDALDFSLTEICAF